MSLDFYLETPDQTRTDEGGIFIRENGSNRKISREEWDQMHPGEEPCVVLPYETQTIFHANITHNLGKMADAAGIYRCLWYANEFGVVQASDLIEPLQKGLGELKAAPSLFKVLNPANGWGNYEALVEFVEEVLKACKENPGAKVNVSI